ncbi:hypothetical protein TTRE_0000147101 [Trichuris trichiura]|uniref:Uncharacterized protein n=1 Tax=Trichuris trichiura TaxID=36087 RepID=A0A077YYS2_TRITR|nr:hypothetical protein TTRE_0000147101 [Trichuris trichiura]
MTAWGRYSAESLPKRRAVHALMQQSIRENPSLFSMESPVGPPTASELERKRQNELCCNFRTEMLVSTLRDCDVDFLLQQYERRNDGNMHNLTDHDYTNPTMNTLMTAGSDEIVPTSEAQHRVMNRRDAEEGQNESATTERQYDQPQDDESWLCKNCREELAKGFGKASSDSKSPSNDQSNGLEEPKKKSHKNPHGLDEPNEVGGQIRSPPTPEELPPPPPPLFMEDDVGPLEFSTNSSDSEGPPDLEAEVRYYCGKCGVLRRRPTRRSESVHTNSDNPVKNGPPPNGSFSKLYYRLKFMNDAFQRYEPAGHPRNHGDNDLHQLPAITNDSATMECIPAQQYQHLTLTGTHGNEPYNVTYSIPPSSVLQVHIAFQPNAAPLQALPPMGENYVHPQMNGYPPTFFPFAYPPPAPYPPQPMLPMGQNVFQPYMNVPQYPPAYNVYQAVSEWNYYTGVPVSQANDFQPDQQCVCVSAFSSYPTDQCGIESMRR